MTSAASSDLSLMLGEMRGQLRELIHNVNNLAQKVEGVARSVDSAAHLPDAIAESKADIAALQQRVSVLEAKEHQRKGALGVLMALSGVVGGLIVKFGSYLLGNA